MQRTVLRAAADAERQGIIEIEILKMLRGRLSARVMGFVVEWALEHREELIEYWRLARESAQLNRIAPLQ
jgi:hypothetical protein